MGNLASAVDELLAVDAHELPTAALTEEITEIHRQIHRLHGAYLSRVEALDRSGAALAEAGSTAAWLRQHLRLSPNISHRDVHLGRDLADVLPATRAALEDGDLSLAHAQEIARLHGAIDADALAAAEPHLADYARGVSPIELHRAIKHVKERYGRERNRRDEQDDFACRRLHASTTIHGLGIGDWQLHPVGQELVMTAIHALSKPAPNDDRTPAQRRADALVQMAEIAMRSGELPVTGGVKPHGTVIVSLETLERRAGAPAASYGLGAVTGTDWARRMLCDADIARVITGAASEILDAGRAARTFTAAQSRAIVARDRHCIWPSCDAPPGWCDAHHRIHWADGGASNVDNGVLLCGQHHTRVHLHHHAITKRPDGHYTVDLRPDSDPRHRGPDQRGGP